MTTTDSPSELAATRDLYQRMSAPQLAQLREDYELDLARALTTRKGAKLEGAKAPQLEQLDATIGSLRFRLGMIDDLQLGREVRSAEALQSRFARVLETIDGKQLEVHRDPAAASTWYVGARDASIKGYGATLPLAFTAWEQAAARTEDRSDD